jgi:hypothetical protein
VPGLIIADTTLLLFELDTMSVAKSNSLILGFSLNTVDAVEVLGVEEG